MNKLDQRIERLAYELFSEQGIEASLVQFKIKELKICTERGYNTRSEILMLIKKAKAVA